MKISIMGYFTHPDYRLEISVRLKQTLAEYIENQILIPFPLPKVKSEILEILLDTDGINEEVRLEKVSKTHKGKYLTYLVLLPYPKIKPSEKIDLEIFINEFFEALKAILLPYGTDVKLIEKCKKSLWSEIKGKEEYVLNLSETQKKWNEAAKKLREQST